MKSTRTFFKFIAFIGIVSVFISSSGGRNGDRAEAPGDNGSCINCHYGNGPGSVTLLGVPAAYVAGQTYSLTLVLNQATQPIGGFQLVATNGINNTPIGAFTTTPGETRIQNTNRLVQSTPKALSGGSVSWTTDWTAPASGVAPQNVVFYYSGMAANGDGNRDLGGGEGEDFGYIGNSSTVLPVELLSFEAKKTNEANILISWETINEEDHDFFAVERSTDSRNFEVIGKVSETSSIVNEINIYDFTDENLPQSEDVYYRLKQVDIDGAFSYSAVRHLRLMKDEVSVFPNPVLAGNDVSVKFEAENAGERNVSLFNIEGKLIFSQKYSIEKGINVLRFSDIIDRGIYFLTLEGIGQMQRIVVQ